MSETSTRPAKAEPLTRDDVTAFRMAESYSLHTHQAHGGTVVRLYVKSYARPAVFSKRAQILFPDHHTLHETRYRDIVADGTVSGYRDGDQKSWAWPSPESAVQQEPHPACFYSGYDMKVWATIGRALRPGSVLHVSWTADNNTEVSRQANLHLDSVNLIATTANHQDTWKIGWSCCPNNTARMIQRRLQ